MFDVISSILLSFDVCHSEEIVPSTLRRHRAKSLVILSNRIISCLSSILFNHSICTYDYHVKFVCLFCCCCCCYCFFSFCFFCTHHSKLHEWRHRTRIAYSWLKRETKKLTQPATATGSLVEECKKSLYLESARFEKDTLG